MGGMLLDNDIKEQFVFRVLADPFCALYLFRAPRFSAVCLSAAKGKTHLEGYIRELFLIFQGNFAF